MDATINTATDRRHFAHLFGSYFDLYSSGSGTGNIDQAVIRLVDGSVQ